MSTRISAAGSLNRKRASARASSVLPTPVGPEKMNDPIGRLRILESGARAANGTRHGMNRLVLTDHRLVDLVFHPQQPRRLGFLDARHRNSGPATDDEGNRFLIDHRTVGLPLRLPLDLHLAICPCRSRSRSRSAAAFSKFWSRTASSFSPVTCFQLLLQVVDSAAADAVTQAALAHQPRRSRRSPCRAGTGR